jgi:hypothetical protein
MIRRISAGSEAMCSGLYGSSSVIGPPLAEPVLEYSKVKINALTPKTEFFLSKSCASCVTR